MIGSKSSYFIAAISSIGIHAVVILAVLANWEPESKKTVVQPQYIQAELIELAPKKKPVKKPTVTPSTDRAAKQREIDKRKAKESKLAQQKLAELISGPLQHEINGVAKRLAGFAVAESLDLNNMSDLEKISCFSMNVNEDELLDAALRQMERVKAVILPDYLHASLLAIERMYSLEPIINLFSDLRFNPAALGNSTAAENDLFELAKPMLEKICSVDRALWRSIKIMFQEQVNISRVSRRDVHVREILHRRPVLPPKVVVRLSQIPEEELIEIIANSLVCAACQSKELSQEVVGLACKWRRFSPDAAGEIKSRALHKLRFC